MVKLVLMLELTVDGELQSCNPELDYAENIKDALLAEATSRGLTNEDEPDAYVSEIKIKDTMGGLLAGCKI